MSEKKARYCMYCGKELDDWNTLEGVCNYCLEE